MTCFLDGREAADGLTFETGNNAELSVELDLCAEHLAEHEADGHAFELKYYERIESIAYDRMVAAAEEWS